VGLRLVAAFAAIVLSATAAAAEGPQGIAFAQAEEGTSWCLGSDQRKAATCALDRCRKDSGGQECHLTRWCFPAGWSGLMIAWLPEFHSTLILCGLPSQAATGAAFESICRNAPEYSRCDFHLVIDPDGAEHPVSDASWPGPSTSPEAADDSGGAE